MIRPTVSISFLLFLSLFTSPSFAASPYDRELSQISAEIRAVMIRADQARSNSKDSLDMQQKLTEISKRLHSIQEEAQSANLELLKQGQSDDKGLIYAAAIAMTLDLADNHIYSYIDTHDKPLKNAASDAMRMARVLMTSP